MNYFLDNTTDTCPIREYQTYNITDTCSVGYCQTNNVTDMCSVKTCQTYNITDTCPDEICQTNNNLLNKYPQQLLIKIYELTKHNINDILLLKCQIEVNLNTIAMTCQKYNIIMLCFINNLKKLINEYFKVSEFTEIYSSMRAEIKIDSEIFIIGGKLNENDSYINIIKTLETIKLNHMLFLKFLIMKLAFLKIKKTC